MKLHHYTEIKLLCVISLPPQLDPISTCASKRMSAQLEFEGITIFIRYILTTYVPAELRAGAKGVSERSRLPHRN